jgi:8-hydroxy-5-deazaflavin:NADPH oxidoreductase
MRIGMLGAGQVAQAVPGHAVGAGHQVVLSNRRGPAFIASVVDRLGPLASAGTPAEAAQAELANLGEVVMTSELLRTYRALPKETR